MFLYGTRKVRRLNRLRFSCRNLHLYVHVMHTLGIHTLNSAYFTSKITKTIYVGASGLQNEIFCIVIHVSILANRPNYHGHLFNMTILG